MKILPWIIFLILSIWIFSPASAITMAACEDYPVEMLALLAAIPIICIVVAIVILYHYATKSAELLFDKIMNIGTAIIVDAAIIGAGLKLFFALSCYATL
jgi:heme O synthase-like polyprenyltransferase